MEKYTSHNAVYIYTRSMSGFQNLVFQNFPGRKMRLTKYSPCCQERKRKKNNFGVTLFHPRLFPINWALPTDATTWLIQFLPLARCRGTQTVFHRTRSKAAIGFWARPIPTGETLESFISAYGQWSNKGMTGLGHLRKLLFKKITLINLCFEKWESIWHLVSNNQSLKLLDINGLILGTHMNYSTFIGTDNKNIYWYRLKFKKW